MPTLLLNWEAVSIWLELPLVKLLIGAVLVWLGVKIGERILQRFFGRVSLLDEKREKTLEMILVSVLRYSAIIGFVFFALSIFVEDFSKLLAGAGILGIVLGFGAQSLVKDLVSGLFFIYEKQIQRDDFVQVNNTYTGVVEEIGIRSMKIRNFSGKLLTVSNGEIHTIENYNRDKMRVIERIITSFYQDPEVVFALLDGVCAKMNEDFAEDLLQQGEGPEEPFHVQGLSRLNETGKGYEYTIIGLVTDEAYWRVSRELRKRLAQQLYAKKIRMAEDNVYYQARMRLDQNR